VRTPEEAGLKVVERLSIQVDQPKKAGGYLPTKKEKMSYLLNFNTD
jgi:GTP cyclohydrolase II